MARQAVASPSTPALARLAERQSPVAPTASAPDNVPVTRNSAPGSGQAPAPRLGWRAALLLCLGIAFGGALGYLVAVRGDRMPAPAAADGWHLKLDRQLPAQWGVR